MFYSPRRKTPLDCSALTDAVPCAACVTAVQAVDKNFTAAAAEQCLRALCREASGDAFALDQVKVCCFRARQLLQEHTPQGPRQWELEEFTQAWKNKVPVPPLLSGC